MKRTEIILLLNIDLHRFCFATQLTVNWLRIRTFLLNNYVTIHIWNLYLYVGAISENETLHLIEKKLRDEKLQWQHTCNTWIVSKQSLNVIYLQTNALLLRVVQFIVNKNPVNTITQAKVTRPCTLIGKLPNVPQHFSLH